MRSGELIEKLRDFRDVTDTPVPDILTHVGESGSNRKEGLQLVKQDGETGVERVWEYGPVEPVKPTFTDLDGDGSLEVLAAYPERGEVRGIDTDGSELWTESVDVSGGKAATLDVEGDGTSDAIIWSGTNVVILDGSTRDASTFSTESPVQRVAQFIDGKILIATENHVVTASPDSGVEESRGISREVQDLAAGDVNGDGETEVVIGFADEVLAVDDLSAEESLDGGKASPEGFWDFEGSGTTIVDRSGNNHTGTIVGAGRVSGRDGKVLEFDRTNQEYAELGEADTLDPRDGSYTVSLWFRTASEEGADHDGRVDSRFLFAKRGDSNERFILKLVDETPGANVKVDNALTFQIKDSGGLGNDSATANQSLADDEWHHVVAVRDADNDEIRLYLDGELVDSSTDNQDDINPNGPAYLAGQPEYVHPDYYTGKIDDVKIWKAAVSPDESEVEPKDPKFIERPPSAVETTAPAPFKISIDPGSNSASEIDATANVDIKKWDKIDDETEVDLTAGETTETGRIVLEGQIPPAEIESSSPYGLRYGITGIVVNGETLLDLDESVTFAFENVEDTAVIFAKYSDSSGDLAPHRTEDGLEKYQRKVEKEVNRYYASQPGSMGAVGFKMEFYDNGGKWFTVKSSDEYDDASFIGYIKEVGTLDRKEFVLDSISEANVVSSDFDSIIGVSPGESEALYPSTGPAAAFEKRFVHVSEAFGDDVSNVISEWCHELGHTLGAEDLYNSGILPGGDLKVLDLMANGVVASNDFAAAPFSAAGRTKYNNLPWLQLNTKSSYSTYTIENKFNKEFQDEVFEFIPIDILENSSSIIVEFRKDQREYGGTPIKNGVYLYETSSANIDNIRNDPSSEEPLYPDPTLPTEGSMTVDLFYFYKCTLKTLPNGVQKKDAEIEISQPTSEAENKTIASADISPPNSISDDVEFDDVRDIPTPDADLHAYDEDGNHIGPNYETGKFENEISGSYVSGDRPGGIEWIAVPEDVNVRFKINTHDVEQWIQEAELSDADIDTNTTYQLALTQYGDDPKVEEIDGERTITDSTTIISEEQTIAPGEESSAATTAMVDFDPDTLNVKSGGKWVTTYLTLPENDVSVEDIELSSIELNGEVEAVTDDKYGFVQDPTKDVDDDGTVEFIAKFPRGDVTELLETDENVRVTISGNTKDNIQIIGSDRIEVTEPGR